MKQLKLNSFLSGVLFCIAVLFSVGLTQTSVKYNNESVIAREFENIYNNVQDKQFNILTSTPAYQNFREGQLMIINSEGTQHIVTRIGTKLYKILLTEI